jgi:hypothetical protein
MTYLVLVALAKLTDFKGSAFDGVEGQSPRLASPYSFTAPVRLDT